MNYKLQNFADNALSQEQLFNLKKEKLNYSDNKKW